MRLALSHRRVFLKNSGENFYWFTLLNCFTVNILFCVIYIPPEGSIYSNIDIFDTIESDLRVCLYVLRGHLLGKG